MSWLGCCGSCFALFSVVLIGLSWPMTSSVVRELASILASESKRESGQTTSALLSILGWINLFASTLCRETFDHLFRALFSLFSLYSSGIHNAILYALIWGRCAGKFVITVSGLNRLVYTMAFQFMYMYIIYGQCGMHVSVISAFCKHLFRLKKGKYFQSHLLCGWEYFFLVFNWHCPALIVKFS